ncbi:MAG: FHA domain-containing protein [bacterium]|jgi:pSer/pThr/pTyr-binding forkhead associated (FHA) protein
MTEEKTLLAGSATEEAKALPVAPCPNCGEAALDADGYCAECGLDLTAPEDIGKLEPEALLAGVVLLRLCAPGGEPCEFPAGTFTIGRADADFTVADAYVSRKHAEIRVADSGISVVDLGSTNGSFVNGERLEKNAPRELAPGDVLKFGQTEIAWEFMGKQSSRLGVESSELEKDKKEALDVADSADLEAGLETPESGQAASQDASDGGGRETEAAAAESETIPSGWRLVCTSREMPPIELPMGATVLGRKAGKCDVVISGDGYISGAHAKIDVREDGIFITDLGSTNGTYVGSEQLPPNAERALAEGESVMLGETELRLDRS